MLQQAQGPKQESSFTWPSAQSPGKGTLSWQHKLMNSFCSGLSLLLALALTVNLRTREQGHPKSPCNSERRTACRLLKVEFVGASTGLRRALKC